MTRSAPARSDVLSFDPAEPLGGSMYHLLNAAIGPRPIAWISTIAPDGTANVAPHSYTTIFSPDPPVVGFVSVGRKDTLRNVEATVDFVYNIASEDLAQKMNLSAADFPPDESEFDWAGLTVTKSDLVKSPRVGEAPVAFEAKVIDRIRIADSKCTLVLGEIVWVHIDRSVVTGDRIDPAKLQAVGRLAGSGFAHLGELFSMQRPTYKGMLDDGVELAGIGE
jgi:flavin reductase (DIM6/NTAB) family NADH-FMN oxidoreductase RutF